MDLKCQCCEAPIDNDGAVLLSPPVCINRDPKGDKVDRIDFVKRVDFCFLCYVTILDTMKELKSVVNRREKEE